jgi:hypothetical protein
MAMTTRALSAGIDAIIGVWRTEGEVLDEAGVEVVATYSGTDSYERFGPFVLHRVDVVLGGEHVEVLEMIGPWDAGRQAFPTTVFDASGGTIERSTADVDDAGTWTFRSGHGTSRGQATIQADDDGQHLRSSWQRTEDDGATWRPWMRAVHTRMSTES